MVYAGNIGEEKFSLGVSGRLQDNNLIMWDEETNSLWNQITGQAVYGDSKGKKLDLIPAVFVGLGTWTRMHPDTVVLDMSPIRSTGWHFTTQNLADGSVQTRNSRWNGQRLDLGVGLRHGNDTLLVPLKTVQKHKLVQVEVDGIPLAVVWHADEKATLVYRLKGGELNLELVGDTMRAGDNSWDALSGEGESGALQRFPYLPSYTTAWQTYYPDGRVYKDK